MGSKPDLHGERLATNHLGYGTAVYDVFVSDVGIVCKLDTCSALFLKGFPPGTQTLIADYSSSMYLDLLTLWHWSWTFEFY